MPVARRAQFGLHLSRGRDLVGLGQSIGSMTNGVVDSSDLYRAALVQGVSALDSYIHGVVLDRAVDILLGRITGTTSPGKGGLSITAVHQILVAPNPTEAELLARTHVAQRLSLETYQKPEDIAAALAWVGVGKIWSTAYPAGTMSLTPALRLVVGRRNRIVHQCDADPLTPGSVTALSDVDALESLSTVESVVGAIDPHC